MTKLREFSWRTWLGTALLVAIPVMAALLYFGTSWSPSASAGEDTAGRGTSGLSLTESRGKKLYDSLCASCHGLKGQGQPNWQKPNSVGILPPPPHDNSGHTWHHGDGTLFDYVREGGRKYDSATFVSAMPAFGDFMSPDEIKSVITYIKTFWGPEERSSQAKVSQSAPFP